MKSLINQTVIIVAVAPFSDQPQGVVFAVKDRSIAIKLDKPLIGRVDHEYLHVVATLRHENKEVADILKGEDVMCGFIFVPANSFNINDPCNTSWWRGGCAAVGDIRILTK